MGKTEPKLFRQTKLKGGYAPAQEFETQQVFTESKDGTRVPMFITHKKGTPLDGSAPTLLYGYGGKPGPSLLRCAELSKVFSWGQCADLDISGGLVGYSM